MVRHNYCTCVNDLVTNGAPKGFRETELWPLSLTTFASQDPVDHGPARFKVRSASEDDEQKRI